MLQGLAAWLQLPGTAETVGFTGLLELCSLPHTSAGHHSRAGRSHGCRARGRGSVSGQGDKVAPATQCELQGLSSVPCLLSLLSAFTKTTKRLHKARNAPGSEPWGEEEWFFGRQRSDVSGGEGRGEDGDLYSSALCANCPPRASTSAST